MDHNVRMYMYAYISDFCICTYCIIQITLSMLWPLHKYAHIATHVCMYMNTVITVCTYNYVHMCTCQGAMAQLLSRTSMLHLKEVKLSKGMYVYISVCAYTCCMLLLYLFTYLLISSLIPFSTICSYIAMFLAMYTLCTYCQEDLKYCFLPQYFEQEIFINF